VPGRSRVLEGGAIRSRRWKKDEMSLIDFFSFFKLPPYSLARFGTWQVKSKCLVIWYTL
jgi:hypothetical protein